MHRMIQRRTPGAFPLLHVLYTLYITLLDLKSEKGFSGNDGRLRHLDKKQSRGGTSAVSSKLASGHQQPIAMLDMPLVHLSAKGRHGDRPSRTPGKRMTSGVQVPCGEGG
jgi:hypothetical protein